MMISGHAEGQQRMQPRLPDLAQREAAVARPAAAMGENRDDAHHDQPEEDAGNQAGEEQGAERHAGDRGVEDHRRARRNQRADARGRGRDRGGDLGGIALALERRNGDRAGAGEVRRRGADHAAEEDAGQHVDLGEAAPEPADQRPRELEQPPRYAARVHDRAREHEQRQGDQRERAHPRDHRLRQGQRPQAAQEEVQDHGREQRDQHRHAEHQKPQEKHDRDHGAGHGAGSPRPGAASASPRASRQNVTR